MKTESMEEFLNNSNNLDKYVGSDLDYDRVKTALSSNRGVTSIVWGPDIEYAVCSGNSKEIIPDSKINQPPILACSGLYQKSDRY